MSHHTPCPYRNESATSLHCSVSSYDIGGPWLSTQVSNPVQLHETRMPESFRKGRGRMNQSAAFSPLIGLPCRAAPRTVRFHIGKASKTLCHPGKSFLLQNPPHLDYRPSLGGPAAMTYPSTLRVPSTGGKIFPILPLQLAYLHGDCHQLTSKYQS